VSDDPRTLRALVVDYGGVLTSPLQDSMASFCEDDEIDLAAFRRVMGEWLGPSYGQEAAINPMHALERGEMAIPDFERELARRLTTHDGRAVEPAGLLSRMFAGFQPQRPMFDVVRRARGHGLRTALLSNSWGMDYPREEWDELFDAVVISGEVGMRKPDPAIYAEAARRLGLPPEAIVYVDDLPGNLKPARALGMATVVHRTAAETIAELEGLLGVPLA